MRNVGLVLGPILFIICLVLPSDIQHLFTVVGIGAWMICWWITECVPLPVSALLPLLLLPALDVLDWKTVSQSYGHRLVFLFFGGFIIALALEKWNLHKRIALKIIEKTGLSVSKIVLGFMLATAFLSMWISNTATTVMMLPIASSFMDLMGDNNPKEKKRYAVLLLLSIAYAANIGGTATLIGTPPNIQMAGILEENFGVTIDFITWLGIGVPFSVVLIFLTYLLLTKVFFPIKLVLSEAEKTSLKLACSTLGTITKKQRIIFWLFMGTIVLWATKDLLNNVLPFQLNDTAIALIPAILFFIIPAKKSTILEWEDTKNLPWGILLLFGGGLTLAAAMDKVQLLQIVTQGIMETGITNLLLLLALLTLISLFLTELMSNLALVSIFVPVVGTLALELEVVPVYFAIPVTLAASCAFMLPMATPPNAIVFASNKIKVIQMVKAGTFLNVLAIILILVLVVPVVKLLF